ncbi:LCP family protein [Pseudonocardia kujensis]|uniref:LCP family protein n=1 Tax=Pseudonocardia kujensis TaxID=1128675 RepID=UPI001E5E4D7E|nr:LCP family protein [Pseudonocardia kujensis]MCE0768236.1 LCP family protein [Pseudonocardia kujensis]
MGGTSGASRTTGTTSTTGTAATRPGADRAPADRAPADRAGAPTRVARSADGSPARTTGLQDPAETRVPRRVPANEAAADRIARRRAEAGEAVTGTGRDRARKGTARRTLRGALATTAASTLVPGTGHLLLRRRRTGGLILGLFLLVVAAGVVAVLTMSRRALLENAVSTTVLATGAVVALVAALGWIAQIARTYALARPRNMGAGRKVLGAVVAAVLCMAVALPFGYAADLANSQRSLLNDLFSGGAGGTAAAEAINKPRLNVLLLGSDAGPDRTGTRTDTMMLASIDTKTGRTTIFGLPRNIQRAEFPPGSPMAAKFPRGFHDPADPLSGNYLLNAVYAYAHENPSVAPPGPTNDIGLNLLQSSISYMTGLPIDYFLEVNMAGFSTMIDALGGVTVDVGPVPLPINGVTADGRHVKPDGYIQPGVQNLNGEEALWFARSRRDSNDYQRMSRQRCLIQAVLDQKSPTDLLANFQQVAQATKDNVDTNIPQAVLPALVSLAGEGFHLQSISFDPSLPDPNEADGRFDTSRPDVEYMHQVVQDAINPPPAAAAPPTTSAAPSTPATPGTSGSDETAAGTAAPTSLAASCAAAAAPAPGDGSGAQGGTESGTGGN